MSIIKSCNDIINNYDYISSDCHTASKPVFITQNEKVDLVAMSIEAYDNLTGRIGLRELIQEGLDDIKEKKVQEFSEAIYDIKKYRKNEL